MVQLTEKIERSLFKISLAIVGVILLLVLGGYFSLRIFHRWQEWRLIAEANALVDKGDYKPASFNAQRVIQINPDSAEANRVLARVAERSAVRTAVDFRRRVVELAGKNMSDLLALAHCAIRFNDKSAAEKALDAVPEKSRGSAEYHALRGDLALMRHDVADYEKELMQAQQSQPQNKSYALALATSRVASNDRSRHDGGVRELQQLQTDVEVGRDATRRLLEDALRRRDTARALDYARELDAFPDRSFADRLLLLTALKVTSDPGMRPLLIQLQKDASEDAGKIAALVAWMNSQQMAVDAVGWIKQFPRDVLMKRTLPLTIAEAFVAAQDWAGLQRFVKGANWGAGDFMRSALLARALRELNIPEEAAQQWNDAVNKVSPHSEQALLLAETAQKWGWRKEALDLLWLAAKDPTKADKTLNALYRLFAAKGETQELYRVVLHLAELHPNNHDVLNNVAQISLLLNLNAERGHRLAREVHEQNPRNVDYASTYAFSLYLRGDIKKAAQVFSDIPEAELHRPQIAAYYGIVLAANGDYSRAAEFLDLGAKANLLPEEKALVEKAKNTLTQR